MAGTPDFSVDPSVRGSRDQSGKLQTLFCEEYNMYVCVVCVRMCV